MVGSVTDWYARTSQPRFEHPPVVETAMGIEFAPIPGLTSYMLARLQESWAAEYSNIQDVPGAPPSQLVQPVAQPMFQINFGNVGPRLWAQNPSTGALVQTQADRLVLNWRADGPGRTYPGYEVLREEYERLWRLFTTFLARNSLTQPSPVFGQYIYVNAVQLTEAESLSAVVALVGSPVEQLPGREIVSRFQSVRDVERSGEHPMGAQIVITGEPQPLNDRTISLNVDTHTIFTGAEAHVLQGIDAAHALSSHTFARIINPAKLESWGRLTGTEVAE